ncbi:MAG: NADH-quinone oxidoreductase subunit L [Actinobacteria bacterium]|nr:NADH-quinone oxidoreductase subunit L [Actinomycetota bacterium]
MLSLLWLIPALPAAGFVLLVLLNRRLGRAGAAWIGAGSVGLSMLAALLVCGSFIVSPPAGDACRQVLWTWMDVAGFTPAIGFYLDAVSVVWVLVITVVGFLIHLYSTEHMEHDEGFTRFFTYLNLFVFSMLVLVLADNLLLLYLGWEGVGLCSYLLIAFWQKDPQNVYSGRKAFIVTRVGDTALIAGLFLLLTQLGTLEIQPLLRAAEQTWAPDSTVAVVAALLILGGAVGKSAQVPLQTWLPDAMAGPSPVSALIHAATMVTAGVYLIARTTPLFELAGDARLAVALVGIVTLLIAGFSALVQHDLKRALAYSTISQIGYMILALGVSGWEAGVFHFGTHAFFKALLFLGAGVVIEALAGEHDIFKMGGLARKLPAVFVTFTVGAAALAALPFVTNGFYSKDLVISTTLGTADGNVWLYVGSILGAFVTTLYSFRLVWVVFFGEAHTEVTRRPRWRQTMPLWVLAVFSIITGFLWLPAWIGAFHPLEDFLDTALPPIEWTGRYAHFAESAGAAFVIILIVYGGIFLSYLLWVPWRRGTHAFAASPVVRPLAAFWLGGWGFDWLYERVFVRPVKWFAHWARHDLVDYVVDGIAWVNLAGWRTLSAGQTGRLRSYVAVAGFGVVLVLAVVVLR